MPGPDKETDLTERIEAFLSDLKRGGTGTGPLRGSAETARETTALLRRITAQARWSSAGALLYFSFNVQIYSDITAIQKADVVTEYCGLVPNC